MSFLGFLYEFNCFTFFTWSLVSIFWTLWPLLLEIYGYNNLKLAVFGISISVLLILFYLLSQIGQAHVATRCKSRMPGVGKVLHYQPARQVPWPESSRGRRELNLWRCPSQNIPPEIRYRSPRDRESSWRDTLFLALDLHIPSIFLPYSQASAACTPCLSCASTLSHIKKLKIPGAKLAESHHFNIKKPMRTSFPAVAQSVSTPFFCIFMKNRKRRSRVNNVFPH